MDPMGKKLHKASDASILQTINVNTFPMVFMTRFLGPDLKARVGATTKSAVINMTSYYSESPDKRLPIYSSAKSFADVWSQNLWYENQEMDILTVKNMPIAGKRSPLGVDAKEVVDGVMLDLGHERISYGHANHSLFRYWLLLKQNQAWFGPNTYFGKFSGL